MADAMRLILNETMRIERSQALKAEPYQRTEKRRGYANGFKPKMVSTRLGELALQVPQVRGDVEFYPSALERDVRSERALKCAIAEMYVQGVSTRKVTEVHAIFSRSSSFSTLTFATTDFRRRFSSSSTSTSRLFRPASPLTRKRSRQAVSVDVVTRYFREVLSKSAPRNSSKMTDILRLADHRPPPAAPTLPRPSVALRGAGVMMLTAYTIAVYNVGSRHHEESIPPRTVARNAGSPYPPDACDGC